MRSNLASWSLKILYVDVPAGFGKTSCGVNWALEQMRQGKKILFILKSIALINEQFEKAQQGANELSNLVYRINGDGKKIKGSVKAKIKQHLEKSVSGTGEILFITEAAMMSLRYFPKPENWIVVFDEIPKIEIENRFKSPDNHSILTEHLKVSTSTDEYLKLIPKNIEARRFLGKLARNPRADDVWRVFVPTADSIATSDFEVYAAEEIWKDHVDLKKLPQKTFVTHAVLHPRKLLYFEKVIMMGAMFTESLLFQVWSKKWKDTVKFVPFLEVLDEIQKNAGSAKHLLNGKLTIRYITDLSWTKKLTRIQVNDKTALSYAIEMVISEFGQDEFVYSLNKNIGESLKLGNGHRLSGSPHGINKFKHINRGAFLSAINPKPETCRFYQFLGLSMADIKKAFMFQYCYQALMRTSLRDPTSIKDVVIIVPSREIAEWFKDYFEGEVVLEKLNGFPEEQASNLLNFNKNSLSDAQRQDKCRRGKWLNEIKVLNASTIEVPSSDYINRDGVTDQSTPIKDLLKIQLFSSRRERPKEENLLHCGSWKEFFFALREFSTKRIDKHSNSLISAAIFGDKVIDGQRTKRIENVEYCSCIIIDRDDGDMTYKQFMELFPGLMICVYNSHKGCGRFRAIIPLSQKVPAAVYTDICRSLRAKIENAGFSRMKGDIVRPCHGIDQNGFAATSVFYIPCLPASGKPEDSFFVIQEGSPLDSRSLILNPLHSEVEIYNAGNTKASKALNSCIFEVDFAIREVKAAQQISEYAKLKKDEGGSSRRSKFMGLCRTLSNLGFSESELVGLLHEADHDGARAKNGDIQKALQTIRKRS